MCIIIGKPKGIALPPLEHMEESWDSNPHGFSCMWGTKKNKVGVFKTMSRKDALEFYKSLLKNASVWNDKAMSFHFRYATHGSKNIQNCHGYLNDELTLGFQHNGIFAIKVPSKLDITDSEYVFKSLIVPAFNDNNNEMPDQEVLDFISGYSNKLSFIFRGNLYTCGNFSKENGCFYSNTSYKKYVYPVRASYKMPSPVYKSASGVDGNVWGGTNPCSKCDTYDCMNCSKY